jgi:hypothetical protein
VRTQQKRDVTMIMKSAVIVGRGKVGTSRNYKLHSQSLTKIRDLSNRPTETNFAVGVFLPLAVAFRHNNP